MPAERSAIRFEPAADVESLRKRHQVRLIEPSHEGKAIHKLPSGVYGFTAAPLTETPLFAKKIYQSFEYHKRADGATFLIGYVSPKDESRVYPDSWGEATQLVSIEVASFAPADNRLHREPGNPIMVRYS
jgi:hypothetical protein